jgi:hypothetical protein
MSALNAGVCDIDVNGDQMCGQVFANQPSLRHIRNEHTGALLNPSTVNITQAVRIAGENCIEQLVLSGGRRDARYNQECGGVLEVQVHDGHRSNTHSRSGSIVD